MSTNATTHGDSMNVSSDHPADKGKGKPVQDEVMGDEEGDDDDDEEEEEEDEEDEEMAEEESLDEIDPSLIQPRRTRGKRVDYTSAEALAKAGYKPGETAEDDEEDTYEAANDSAMQD
ncbi:hypothetical protein BC835DRAFT_1310415 [Cytidiella melzeri]|nr:hypothetical protein BC835DRAFT_1310415 [Cytidiella melzeri]